MSQFASKTPRDLNHDPEPWHDPRPGTSLFRGDGPWGHAFYDPRPEFDHVQHNKPNPILLDFRDMDGIAELWLETIDGPEGDSFLAETPKEFGRIDAAAIGHARRVLERLARLSSLSGEKA